MIWKKTCYDLFISTSTEKTQFSGNAWSGV
jgi:hypothetical protein